MTEEIKIFDNYLNSLISYPFNRMDKAYIINYITNLQKENENLKEENKRIFSRVNDDELLISNAMNYAELQDYKSRNEKGLNQLITLIQIIGEQPSKNVEEDKWLLSKLKNMQNELQGGNEKND